MNWNQHIVSDEKVLLGKPTNKGTRLAVEYIVDRLANGWTEEDLSANHSRLTKESLKAVFAFLSDRIKGQLLINTWLKVA